MMKINKNLFFKLFFVHEHGHAVLNLFVFPDIRVRII